MEKTGIIWTEKTWNPVTGCQKVSSGCRFCYAETIANQYGGKAFPNGFEMTLKPYKLNDPFKWKTPSLVFVNSMSDLFWNKIPEQFRHQIINVIRDTPQHEYQVLTKRAEDMMEYSNSYPLPDNFWAGVTIEDQESLHRLESLKKTKAKIKFISFEPLLGPMPDDLDLTGIDWVITGGESGGHAWKKTESIEKRMLVYYENKKWHTKPKAIEWVNSILNSCRKSGTHFFHKQWGGNYPEAGGRELNGITYSEIPKLPADHSTINNDYLIKLENQN